MTPATAISFNSSVSSTSNILVANYSITVPEGSSVTVNFGRTTNYGLATSAYPAPVGGGPMSILVAGMTAGATYHMQAVVKLHNGTNVCDIDHTFTTGALPPVPNGFPTVTATSPGQPNPGIELVNMVSPSLVSVATDLDGNIIWYYYNPADDAYDAMAFPIKPMPDGHFMMSVSNRYSGPSRQPWGAFRVVDLAGNTVMGLTGPRQITLDQMNAQLLNLKTPRGSVVQATYFSHDFLMLPNGHVIVLVQEFKQVQVGPNPQPVLVWGDALVDLDEHFQAVWVWSAFDYLDVNRHPYEFPPDWTHCNAVLAAPDGNILVSIRNQSWILKLDYAGKTGNILWTLGDQGTFNLNAATTDDWFYAQHCPIIFTTADDKITSLSVFDNGNYRNPQVAPSYSRAAIIELNEESQQAQVEWQYLTNLYSYWGGDVDRMANGNIEVCISAPSPVATPDPPLPPPLGVSIVREVSYGQEELVWQMKLNPSNAYRSFRLPSLYPGVQW